MNLLETEKAYLAGIFDGEGSIGIYPSKPGDNYVYHRVYFVITNTDFTLAQWIKDRIPIGNFKIREIRKDNDRKRPCWEWQLCGWPRVKIILDLIQPYVVIKAKQVNLVLSLLDDERKEKGHRGEKLSPHFIERRERVAQELKAMKIAPTQFVH